MNGSFNYFYIDEFGENPTRIAGELLFTGQYCFSPPEPMVKYYKDGSGYPGCEAEFELFNFRCDRINTENGIVQLDENIKSVSKWLENKFKDGTLFDELITHISETIKDMEDAAIEAKWEQIREQEYEMSVLRESL